MTARAIQRKFPSPSSEELTNQDKSVFRVSYIWQLSEENEEMYWRMR